MTDARQTQLQYELDSDNDAQAKKLRELVAASKRGDVSLPRAHALVGRLCGLVQEKLEEYADVKTKGLGGKYKTWLRELPSDVAAVIAIRECIRLCTSPETHVHVQDLTNNVGRLWELEVRIRQAQKLNPMYMQKVDEQLKDHATQNLGHIRRLYNVAIERVFKGNIEFDLTKADTMQIGKFGVDACYASGMLEQVRGVNKNGTMVSYVLAPEVLEFVQGYNWDDVRGIISKEETRMLCPPDPWKNLGDGGYLSLRRKAAAPLMNIRRIRRTARPEVSQTFTAANMPAVFHAGNYLQSVPYTFHEATRASVLRVWESGGGVLGVPSKTSPKRPEFPFADTWDKTNAPESELTVFKEWKRSVAGYYEELREWRSRVREVGSFLKSVAESSGPFWFPVYCDSRGRWYYRGLPNPQGSDIAKAFLHFNDKKPLGEDGLFWLRVQVANSYGYDKERLRDRAAWTEANWGLIERALDAPENHPEVWGKDAPWCMYAAAYELRNALRSGHPASYLCGLPVAMDATCSGLQHFSALLRDPVGGECVNLTDKVGHGPKQDIYTKTAQACQKLVQADAISDGPDSDTAKWALGIELNRELAKKPVMTFVYGATLRGTAEHVESVLQSRGVVWPEHTGRFSACTYIAKKLFQGIGEAVPAATNAMNWLRDIAGKQPAGKRMTWKAPTGFVVQHDYQDFTDRRIKLNSCGVVHVWVREWSEGTKRLAMQNAIAPNFVHALDAAHLTFVANRMQHSGLSLVAVHDSFGTHACDVTKMQSIIREEFALMYSKGNIMSEFMWDVQTEHEQPERGTLDVTDVLDSEFMFS